MKICIVEDQDELASTMKEYLAGEGYVCDRASTFAKANQLIHLYEYDCLVVDINLPDHIGLDLIPIIKETQPGAGILIVSARNALNDKVAGLDLGADDYITKPFHFQELNARIRSVIRRRSLGGNKEISFSEITICPDEHYVKVNGTEVTLTRKEFELLLYFITNQNRLISKESIAEHLWGDFSDTMDSYDFIYAHIKNLRKKLIKAGSTDYIQTIHGLGYKFSQA